MLINADKLIGYPILSLHVNGMIAKVTELIIDPNSLKVIAFRLEGPEVGGENGTILQTQLVREFSELGMVIDSIDDFVNPGDVVKLDKILDIRFELIGKKVESKKGSKIGKIISFTVNTKDFMVQQFVVQRPLIKSFLDPELIIGRSEVIKVTDDKVIVKDEEDKIRKNGMREDFVPNFVNPFREARLAPEADLAQADNQTPDESDS